MQNLLARALALAFYFLTLFCAPMRAQEVEFPTAPAIRIEQRARANQRVWVARIDLSDAKIDVRVARGGADPDGDGPWQTTLLPLSQISEREHFELAINGDFFAARATADAEGAAAGFTAGKWARAVGPAVTDGFAWATAPKPRPVLMLDADNRARIFTLQEMPAGARQVIAGSDLLLLDGKRALDNSSAFALNRHPRTAVGLADGGATLVCVVVDGRDAPGAIGMTLGELSDLMADLGCADALNLDGGGSSEMIARDAATGQLRVLNKPSDGRERAVANALGISVRGSLRAP